LSDAKKCGDEFLVGEFLLSRTEHAEGAEVFVTSDFRLHFLLPTSRFLLRIASFHAGCLHPKRGISVCAIDSRFSLARTADAEGAEVIYLSVWGEPQHAAAQ